MTSNLLPCPFCGGEAGDHDHGQEYWVKCQACGVLSAQTTDRATADALWNTRAAPVVERQETVPKHKFDTLVQHCKRLDAEIAQARAHVNEVTLYQQNAVWFWQHDGEDYLQSLSCPIIIQPHHLRELLEGKAQHNPIASQPAPVAVVLPPRKSMPLRDDYSSDEDGNEEFFEAAVRVEEHNACLDKVKELNQ